MRLPAELARALSALDESQEKPRDRPLMLAQYNELRSTYDALQKRHDIRPGMFVRFKKGASLLAKTGEGLPVAWIVIRMLNHDNEIDFAMVQDRIRTSPVAMHGLGFDCLIATVDDDNGVMVMEMTHSSTLIPVSVEEAEAF